MTGTKKSSSWRSRVRYWIRRLARRAADGPSHCRNCGSLSFTHWLLNDIAPRWTCDDCGYIHTPTFGGTWRVTDPEEGGPGWHTQPGRGRGQ